jgi:DNA-binding PadR family transcriptional regulator
MSRAAGLSAGEMVLGLLVERPDHRFGLRRRLEARFGSAQFSASTTYSAVKRLEKDGYVQAVAPACDGEVIVYEATAAGVARYCEWVCAPTSAPVTREELHAKIALCEPRHLPRLIDMVYGEEQVCIAELDRVRARIVAEQGGAARCSLSETPWSELMRSGVVHAEAAHWGGRIAQLGQLRGYLEELRGEAERRALAAHRHGEAERRALEADRSDEAGRRALAAQRRGVVQNRQVG